MDPLVGPLVLVALAILGARLSFSTESIPAGPRLLLRTGTHFLVLGFFLGPVGLGLVTEEATDQLSPLLALGLGWVGFHFGLQLSFESLKQFPFSFHALAAGQAALTFLLFLGGGYLILMWAGFGGEIPLLLLLGAASTAAVTTPAGIAIVSANFFAKGRVRDLLLFVASVDAWVGILALQITYAIFRPDAVSAGVLGAPQFLLIGLALGLGAVCGIVFVWLTRQRPPGEELVLYLLGICAFAAGGALQWGLSPLFVSLVMGVVVANFSRSTQRLLIMLQRWEKVIYVTFLLLAGALLRVPAWWVGPAAVAYTVLRFGAKSVASATMVSVLRFDFDVPGRLGLGLIPQGGISLAMAASGVLVYSDLQVRGYDAEATLFSIVVIGVLLSELIGPFFTVKLLRRSGEISAWVEAAIEQGDEVRARREVFRSGDSDS